MPETPEMLAQLAAFPAKLRQQVVALEAPVARAKPGGEWSVIENVGHLIDIETIWKGRFQHMLSAENPTLFVADVDEMVRQQRYQEKDAGALLDMFATMRAETVAFIRSLKPMQLERTGVHPKRGPLTVATALGAMADHDQLHTDQITKTVAEASSFPEGIGENR